MAFGICGAGPVSTCKVHEFVLVRVIACLLSFYLYRLAARNGSSHCIGPKKKQATLLVCFFVVFVSLFVRLFICLLACLFVCLILFSFVSFLVSFLFDDRCCNKCQNLDEYFDKNREKSRKVKKLRN